MLIFITVAFAVSFIFGTVAKKNKQYGSEVEAAMKRFAKEDKNAYLIDMSVAELMGDRLHFNQNTDKGNPLKRLYLYVHRGWRTNAKCVF